jgi:hypothetical protein
MKITTNGSCIAALIALSVMAFARDKTVNDGYWWSSSDRSFKLGFVTGYVTGMGEAGVKAIAQCASLTTMLKDKYPDQNLFQKLCLDQDNFDGIPMGQFVDGVEEFYKDFRNKQLDVSWALQYVRDQIKGKPAKELDAELTIWRVCQAAYSTGDSKKILDACKVQ